MAERNRFYFYNAWLGYFSILTDDQCKQFILAIGEYILHEKETEFTDEGLKYLFGVVLSQLKSDRAEYKELCETNKENGSKGGRPPKSKQEAAPPKERQLTKEDQAFADEFNRRCDEHE